MPTKTRQPNNKGIHAYLQMKQFRSEFTFSVTPEGEKFWSVNGHKMSDKMFNKMYPLELTRPNVKGATIGHKQSA